MNIIRNLFLIFTIFCVSTAFAKHGDELSLISVTGSAELHVVPDEVHVSFMIEKSDVSLSEAQRKNDAVANRILRIMKKDLKIDKDNIKTDMINVRPIYEYTKCGYKQRNCVSKREFSRFETKKSFSVKLVDDEKLQRLLDESIKAGVTHIQNVTFASSKFKELLNKAQVLATIDAKKRAKRVANSIGATIGSPHRINVKHSYDQHPKPHKGFARSAMSAKSMDAGGSGDTIAMGQLKIKANVSASFNIK